MHVAVVHDRVGDHNDPDAVDALCQAETVRKALEALGHTSVCLDCSLDFEDVGCRLEQSGVCMVVNLVESIEGKGRLIHLFPFFMDAMGLPYTGAAAEAMLLTSNKLLAKKRMSAAGIPTPPWVTVYGEVWPGDLSLPVWIVKSVWEHASIGIGESSLVETMDSEELRNILKTRAASLGGEAFAEAFVDGREFNMSILAGRNGPEVLPPAEIIFESYTPDMPKIVDYRAKWDETAYAYNHTPRTFDFEPDDLPLLETIKKLTLDCWKCFGLSGYARVDFRVDTEGAPWVLEVNANPCLSPDAGFAAALERAGISFEAAMDRILKDVKLNHRGFSLIPP